MEQFFNFVFWGGGYAIAALFFLVASMFRRRLPWCVIGWLMVAAQALYALNCRIAEALTHHYTPPDVEFIFSGPGGIVIAVALAGAWSYLLLRKPQDQE